MTKIMDFQSYDETADEQSKRLQAAIEPDLDLAFYNKELKDELRGLPTWQVDAIFANVLAKAGFGQKTRVRQQVDALQRALRDIPIPVHKEETDHAAPYPECKTCDLIGALYVIESLVKSGVNPRDLAEGLTETGILATINAVDYLRMVAFGDDINEMDK